MNECFVKDFDIKMGFHVHGLNSRRSFPVRMPEIASLRPHHKQGRTLNDALLMLVLMCHPLRSNVCNVKFKKDPNGCIVLDSEKFEYLKLAYFYN